MGVGHQHAFGQGGIEGGTVEQFTVPVVARLAGGDGKCLRLEFSVAPQQEDGGLTSSGLLIVNPPWTLAGELKIILPELERPLGRGGVGRYRLDMLKS